MDRPTGFVSGSLSRILIAAAVTGVLTGLVVAAFEQVTTEVLLEAVLSADVWVYAAAPTAGLVLAALVLRYVAGGASPATSDEYVRAYHDRSTMRLGPLPGRLLAGVTTIGLGGALGLEGPAIYAGSTIGSTLQARLSRFFSREDVNLLMVAGAAAGVAAVFKTPATGVIFALEAPYRDDVARRALLPALVASASSYIVFVALVGTAPLFPSFGALPDLQANEIVGAVVLGLLAGLGGRSFAWLVLRAKRIQVEVPLPRRILFAAVMLGGLALASDVLFDEPLTLGPGYEAVEWIGDPSRSLPLVALLLAMRVVATVTTIGAGGTGGLFIPLAVQGAILGRLVGGWLGESESGLYPTIGLAAFLGAGYRAPIAAVMFVAESTRGSLYVVPALIAAAASQLVAGSLSVSEHQRAARRGHLEQRFTLPISSALTTDVLTVPPDATAAEFVWVHVLGRRERSVPVVDGGRYLGMCDLERVSEIDRREWEETPVDQVMNSEVQPGSPSWTLRQAMVAMEEADVDVLAVADENGGFIGVVYSAEILKLEEILDETGG